MEKRGRVSGSGSSRRNAEMTGSVGEKLGGCDHHVTRRCLLAALGVGAIPHLHGEREFLNLWSWCSAQLNTSQGNVSRLTSGDDFEFQMPAQRKNFY